MHNNLVYSHHQHLTFNSLLDMMAALRGGGGRMCGKKQPTVQYSLFSWFSPSQAAQWRFILFDYF